MTAVMDIHLTKLIGITCDSRLLPWNRWDLHSPGTLWSITVVPIHCVIIQKSAELIRLSTPRRHTGGVKVWLNSCLTLALDGTVVNLMPWLLLYLWQNNGKIPTPTPPSLPVANEWKLVWNQMPTLQNENNTGVAWICLYVYGGEAYNEST
jgi:hypothetical protein